MRTFLPIFALLALLLAATLSPAQTPTFDRAIVCGSGTAPFQWGPQQIEHDRVGNMYVAGTYNGTVTLGNTTLTAVQTNPVSTMPGDIFIAKYDNAGVCVWASQAADNQAVTVGDILVDNLGQVYITGSFRSYSASFGPHTVFNSSALSEGFIAKLDGVTGRWLWVRRIGGAGNDFLGTMALNSTGTLYVTGQTTSNSADFGSVVFQSGQYGDTFLAKIDDTGYWQWVRKIGVNRPNIANMLVDAQDHIYLGGTFDSPGETFGGFTLSTQVITGTPYLVGSDVFVAKLTDAGTWLWAVQGNATGQNLITAANMAYDGVGSLYLVGSYVNQSARFGTTVLPNLSAMAPQPNPLPPTPYTNNYYEDAFVARLDASNRMWRCAIRTGGPYVDRITQVKADAQGRVYVGGGWLNSTLTATTRLDLGQLDGATANWRWVQSVSDIAARPFSLAPNGQLWMGGFFTAANVNLGNLALIGAANRSSGFLARLGVGPLSTRPTQTNAELTVWPNPAPGRVVQVSGVRAGQLVEVLDVLGRRVAAGQMPTVGALTLALGASVPAGLYVVRADKKAEQLIIR